MRTIGIISLAITLPAGAAVERYKDEAQFKARLAELGHVELAEDFEGSAWDGVRSNYPTLNQAASITSKRITYSSAGRDLWTYPGTAALISTNQNWGRGGSWGIYDNYLASTLRMAFPETVYGVGCWVNTNPDGEDVGVLFEGRTTADDPGYVMPGYGAMYPGDVHPAGHEFIGFIDPGGFTEVILAGTLEVNEENVLEGAVVWGADDFTFAVASSFVRTPLDAWRAEHFTPTELANPALEAILWGTEADADFDGLSNDVELALGTDPRDGTDSTGGMSQSMDGGLLTLIFLRRNDDPALSAVAQLSHDLVGWDENALEVLFAVDQGDGYDLVTVRQIAAASPAQRAFVRVFVTR